MGKPGLHNFIYVMRNTPLLLNGHILVPKPGYLFQGGKYLDKWGFLQKIPWLTQNQNGLG